MTAPARLLIVDDHPLFRSGLRDLLDGLEAVEVIGEAATAPAAVAAARRLRPDIVLMDINLDGGSGIEATRAIVSLRPDTAVLALTMIKDQAELVAMVRAGARGYLLKGSGVEELARAVEAVRADHMVFSGDVAEQLVHEISERDGRPAPAFPDLTDRERAVLELVADGRDNAAIARELYLSVKTVRNYLSKIFVKLQVAHRAEAAVLARRAGLGH